MHRESEQNSDNLLPHGQAAETRKRKAPDFPGASRWPRRSRTYDPLIERSTSKRTTPTDQEQMPKTQRDSTQGMVTMDHRRMVVVSSLRHQIGTKPRGPYPSRDCLKVQSGSQRRTRSIIRPCLERAHLVFRSEHAVNWLILQDSPSD